VTPTVHPETVLKQLNELWASLASANAENTSEGIVRACAMTLIVVERAEDALAPASEVIADLNREHPSRAIVLRLGAGSEQAVDARVNAQCWMPFGRREQICCEQIEISAAETNIAELRPFLLALAAPDLPVILWCRSSGMVASPGFAGLCGLAHKVIVDTDGIETNFEYVRTSQGPERSKLVADLAWTRLTRWREIIAQMFENPSCRKKLSLVERAEVLYSGERVPSGARYFAAWLARELGWEPGSSRIGFRRAPGNEQPAVTGVRMTAPGLTASIARVDGEILEVEVNEIRNRAGLATRDEASLLREELSILGRDLVFEQTLAAVESTGKA
jgi:glucose-6-phosphate dehydrogenase assembly protein OpcA